MAADNGLRMTALLIAAVAAGWHAPSAWQPVALFLVLPFVVQAPLNGAISNGLPKRWVLVGSAAYCLLVISAFFLMPALTGNPGAWWVLVGLTSIGAAVYSPARDAVLPGAARATRRSLARLNGYIGVGQVAAGLIGLGMAISLKPSGWPNPAFGPILAVATSLSLVSLIAAIPADFPAESGRRARPCQAVLDFFHDARRVLGDRQARDTLLGLAGFVALLVMGCGVLLASAGAWRPDGDLRMLWEAMAFAGAGATVGALLASYEDHPRRGMGLIPPALTGMVAGLLWASGQSGLRGSALTLGLSAGLVTVPLRASYQAIVPAAARGNAMALLNAVCSALVALLVLAGQGWWGTVGMSGQLLVLAAAASLGAVLSWRALYRESLELLVDILLRPFYRVRARGPGLERFPPRGPALIVANHSAWPDPVWLAKVLPRLLTPMMTSVFYDLPGLRWLMVHVVHAIRVEASTYRREAPELREAVAALDRGQCVLIFPEGSMRRHEWRPIRTFAQGVWHILRERPDTPVIPCWIEGGWGSFFSYLGGRPTKNKRFDWWRRIEIAVDEPRCLDPNLLADQRATRIHVATACLQARRLLGLEPFAGADVIPEPALAGDEEESGAPD